MTSTIDISGGVIKITEGARTVFTTSGKLVNLLPANITLTQAITYPDFTKDYMYDWWWLSTYSIGIGYGQDNGCSSQVTVVPQEWSNPITLMAAPAGADIFAGMIKIQRTTAPSHTWGGSTVQVNPVENQWIPFSGSVLLETEVGMARAMSVYISGGNLVLHQQQSVSVPSGGYQNYGDAGPIPNVSSSGEEITFGSAGGIGVYSIDVQNSPATNSNLWVPQKDNHKLGKINACSIVDPTNYSSAYSIQIKGQFGRRS